MVNEPYSPYVTNRGALLLKALQQEGLTAFTVNDAKRVADPLKIGDQVLRQLLYRMSKSQWIRRIRRGVYVLVDSSIGGIGLHPFVVASHLVEPCAISHWSALAHHGLTDQIPRHVTATTTKHLVTPSMRNPGPRQSDEKHTWEMDGVRYEFFVTIPNRYFGHEDIWVGEQSKVKITDKERTVLDLFLSPRVFGGITLALATLEEHRGELNLDRLVRHALQLGVDAVAKRVGWALQNQGAQESAWGPLKALPITGFRPLDSTLGAEGKHDSAWGLRINLPWKSRP